MLSLLHEYASFMHCWEGGLDMIWFGKLTAAREPLAEREGERTNPAENVGVYQAQATQGHHGASDAFPAN